MSFARKLKSFAVFGAITLSGCAGFSPYTAPDLEYSSSKIYANGETEITVPAARAYVLEQMDLWRSRANRSATGQHALNTLTLSTAAIAAYFGVTGDRGESAIAALTGVSALSYAGGVLSNETPRQQIYLAGQEALSCVMIASAPLALNEADRQALSVYDLAGLLDRVTIASNAVQSSLGTAQDAAAADKTRASAAVETAKLLVPRANAASNKEAQLRAAIDQGGVLILGRVQVIEAEVNRQLSAQEPSPEAVLRAAQGFSGVLTTLQASVVPDAGDLGTAEARSGSAALTPAQRAAAIAQLKAATDALEVANTNLSTAVAAVNRIVEPRSGAMLVAQQLDKCDVDGADAKIDVAPTTLTPSVTVGQPYRISISGGSSYFRTLAVGPNSSDTEIQNGETRNPVITFKASQAGQQLVEISDVNRPDIEPIVLTFTVTAASAEVLTRNDTSGPARAPEPALPGAAETRSALLGGSSILRLLHVPTGMCPTLSETQIAIAQLGLLPDIRALDTGFVDGHWGPRTDRAAEAYFSENGIGFDSSNDMECNFAYYVHDQTNRTAFLTDARQTWQSPLLPGNVRRSGGLDKCNIGRDISVCWQDQAIR